MALLKKWFCCQLDTAAVVIGWIEAVLCLIASIVFGILLSSLDEVASAFVQPMIQQNQFTGSQFGGQTQYSGGQTQFLGTQTQVASYFIKMDAKIWLSIFFVLTLVNLMSSTALIYGAMKNKRLFLLPWLVGKTISNVVHGIFLLIITLALFATDSVNGALIALYILGLFYFAFHLYLWLSIHSLFCKIRENESQSDNVPMLQKDDNLPYTQFI